MEKPIIEEKPIIKSIIKRIIERSRLFNKDFNRIRRGRYRLVLGDKGEFWVVVNMLAADEPLPLRYRDHPLIGNWKGHRECHIKPDLLLIYQKTDDNRLILVNLGSHAKVFKK